MMKTRHILTRRRLVCLRSGIRFSSYVALTRSQNADEKARAEMAKKAGGKGPLASGGIKKSGKK
jgi:hypothetical protein